VTIAPVDLENGDCSIGVTLIRDEGESKDCDRMRTVGEGVRGGAVTLAILMRPRSSSGRIQDEDTENNGKNETVNRPGIWPGLQSSPR
jgi:hypothetical protein